METETVTIELPLALARSLRRTSQQRGVDLSTFVRVALANLNRRSMLHDLETPFAFGKYRDEATENVIRCDPSYVQWCLRNMERFELSSGALALLERVEATPRNGEVKEAA